MSAVAAAGFEAGISSNSEVVEADLTRARNPHRVVWYTLVGATAAFAGLQHVLVDLNNQLEKARFGESFVGFSEEISIARFLVFTLGALLIAAAGRHLLFVVPLVCAVWIPAVVGTEADLFPPGPSPLGLGWAIRLGEYSPPSAGLLWLGTVIDSSLVLAPAAVFTWRTRRRPIEHTYPAALQLAAVAFSVLVFVLHVHTRVMGEAAPLSTPSEIARLAPFFVMGLLAVRRPWWPWAVPLLALAGQAHFLVPMLHARQLPPIGDLQWLWQSVIAAGIGSAWPLTVRVLSAAPRRPVALALAVNALNIADAVLTVGAVRTGEAVEANPVVDALGMPFKILLVAACTVWLNRRRPNALVWPFLGLSGVFAWHLTGLALAK